MKKQLVHKELIWVVLSLLAGMVAISDEIQETIEMYRWGITFGVESIYLFIFQFLFFTLFTRLILQATVYWMPIPHMHIKQFAASAGILTLFTAIAGLFISPWIHHTNEGVAALNSPLTANEDVLRQFHQLHYFHEPHQAWMADLFIVWMTVYILSRIYLLVLRKNEIEQNYERLKNENLQSRMDALNNQINPHFFFNSLNSLYGLIAEDRKQQSLDYLSNLSQVFRYILQSEKKKLVTLREELTFLNTYRYMLAVKYESKLTFDIRLDDTALKASLPVLSLLPLVENVIKHNEISSRCPMRISITATKNSLQIHNPKHPKLDEVEKTGIGLSNLNNRFVLLTGKEIGIESKEEYYQVSLPLTTMNV